MKFGEDICKMADIKKDAERCGNLAEQVEVSFKKVFLNEHGYLFDYVDEHDDYPDWSVRPNMIFAVAFVNSPLTLSGEKESI